MTLLKAIYDYVIAPAVAEIEESRKAQEMQILSQYNKSLKAGRKSKLDYSTMCKNIKRNNEQHEFRLNKKVAKWDWLKRLFTKKQTKP